LINDEIKKMQKHIIYFISQDFVQINKNKNDGIDEDVWLVPSLDIIGEENACFGPFGCLVNSSTAPLPLC
jgi:hypothetical protein